MARQATVVSILPQSIYEQKPGLAPSTYRIDGVEKGDIEVLIVADNRYIMHVMDQERPITVPVPCDEVARAVVDDYVHSQLAVSDDPPACPGLFWVEGGHTKADIEENFGESLAISRIKQNNWFKNLVHLGDDDWNKYHQHRMISDIQRIAAKDLGLSRDWLSVTDAVDVPRCPACGSTVAFREAVICSICRCILNAERYNEFKFADEPVSPRGFMLDPTSFESTNEISQEKVVGSDSNSANVKPSF
jgi:hypothetical protein